MESFYFICKLLIKQSLMFCSFLMFCSLTVVPGYSTNKNEISYTTFLFMRTNYFHDLHAMTKHGKESKITIIGPFNAISEYGHSNMEKNNLQNCLLLEERGLAFRRTGHLIRDYNNGNFHGTLELISHYYPFLRQNKKITNYQDKVTNIAALSQNSRVHQMLCLNCNQNNHKGARIHKILFNSVEYNTRLSTHGANCIHALCL